MIDLIKKDLEKKSSPEKAKILQRFFKTGKGQYGEGDLFIGVTVPEIRRIANKYKNIKLSEIQRLLDSKIHEHRVTGLIILVKQFEKSQAKERDEIFNFYIKNFKNINNWDLVDLSSHHIVGFYLLDNTKKIDLLYQWAKSDNLWVRRIAIISTYEFIRKNRFEESLKLAQILLQDKHDLIHKAVGWMLREIGKRDQQIEEIFLEKHHKKMPRTMLRYSIEKFIPEKRKYYMAK